MPADAGTAFVKSFHFPKFSKAKDEKRQKLRKKLWSKLIVNCFISCIIGTITVLLTNYFCPNYPFITFLILMLALMSAIDEKFSILPDVLTVPSIILGFFAATYQLSGISPEASIIGAICGYIIPMITSALTHSFLPEKLGGGDVKLLAGIGSWFGITGLVFVIIVSIIPFAISLYIKRSREGSYGLSVYITVILYITLTSFDNIRILLNNLIQ